MPRTVYKTRYALPTKPQRMRPSKDLSTGNWSSLPLYSKINEKTPDDDTSYIEPGANSNNDAFEVQMNDAQSSQEGEHKLTVRLKKTASHDVPVTISVSENGTTIASKTVNQPSSSYADYSLTLSESEIASITDYAKLEAKVKAGSCQPCCGDLLPDTLTLTVTRTNSVCPDFGGATVTLNHNSSTDRWEGTQDCLNGQTIPWEFYCENGEWILEWGDPTSYYASPGWTCDPAHFIFGDDPDHRIHIGTQCDCDTFSENAYYIAEITD